MSCGNRVGAFRGGGVAIPGAGFLATGAVGSTGVGGWGSSATSSAGMKVGRRGRARAARAITGPEQQQVNRAGCEPGHPAP